MKKHSDDITNANLPELQTAEENSVFDAAQAEITNTETTLLDALPSDETENRVLDSDGSSAGIGETTKSQAKSPERPTDSAPDAAHNEPKQTVSGVRNPKYGTGGHKRLRLQRKTVAHTVAMTVLFVIAAAFAIFALLPIVLTVLNSFMSNKEIVTNYSAVFNSLSSNVSETKTYLAKEAHLKLIPDMVSIEQYATVLFKSPMYISKFWNSVFLVVPIVAFQMITGSLAAYSFARYRRKRREVLYFIYIILMLMPFQVTLVPNYLIADKLGMIDTVQAIILPGIFSTFSVFLLTKYMRRIPSSYIEAAKLDGAGDWHIFTRICIPMCKSALYAMAILLFIDYWNMVEQPLILLPDPEKQPLSVFLAEINSGEVGIAFAASFIFMVPPLLLFLNGEQYLVEGISKSGLK